MLFWLENSSFPGGIYCFCHHTPKSRFTKVTFPVVSEQWKRYPLGHTAIFTRKDIWGECFMNVVCHTCCFCFSDETELSGGQKLTVAQSVSSLLQNHKMYGDYSFHYISFTKEIPQKQNISRTLLNWKVQRENCYILVWSRTRDKPGQLPPSS